MTIKILIRTIAILYLGITLAACSSPGTKAKLLFEIDSDINPDDNDTPAPLFVRMYELKSDTLFEQADFIALYERDKEVLGGDLIGEPKTLERLKPGENWQDVVTFDDKTIFVGFFAEFLQYQNSDYKLIVQIKGNGIFRDKDKIRIRFSGNTMELVD